MSKNLSTNQQLKVPFEDEDVLGSNSFRTIHYLGSKLRILEFIEDVVNDLDPSMGGICDLFAGSGSLSKKMGNARHVTSVDIQEYSRVICSALLKPKSDLEFAQAFQHRVESCKHTSNLLYVIEPLAQHEQLCIAQALSGNPLPLCDLLENGSIIAHELTKQPNGSPALIKALNKTRNRIKELGFETGPEALMIRHAGGIYFSYVQAAHIDAILEQLQELSSDVKDVFLAALLSTASDTVNTVGKHFAQPIRPRKSDGTPKSNLGKQVSKDRDRDLLSEFENWVTKYMGVAPSGIDHTILKTDYAVALDQLGEDTTIVYADPPYTRDHYSRFYHTLETICLRDDPDVSKTVLGGEEMVSRGLYREDRHQSPFCIKSKVRPAFETLISKARNKNVILLISYSPFDKEKKAHPRLLSTEELVGLAKRYYPEVYSVSPGVFTHSKLNHTSKHLDASNEAEILIVCKL